VKRRVLVLVHPTLVPPASLAGISERCYDEWRTEYDVVHALRAAGHEVAVLGLDDSLAPLQRSLTRWRPHLVFNLLEEFHGVVAYEPYIVGYLELMRQPYTGCNPRGLLLAHDKLLAKQVLAAAGIATPRAVLVRRGARLPPLGALAFPLFVKSATEDASLGISQRSVVRNRRQLQARVGFIHRHTHSDALVEEYIPGREFYCAVLGNERPRCLPLRELRFGALRSGAPRIATRQVKWNRAYQRRHGIGTRPAQRVSPQLLRRLSVIARQAYNALQLSGYARLDFRVRDDGGIFLLEANPNPCLARIEDFAAAARRGGLGYGALLERISRLGLAQRAPWRG
jgi:D-alanine-D-alanine ligase